MRTKLGLAFSFAWIAGYADVICLIRYKVFPSMMTGNLLQLGRSFFEEIDATFLIAIIVCRMGGLAVHYFAERRFAYGTTLVAPFLFVMIIGIEALRLHWPDAFPRKYEVCFLAPVFGVQSAVSMQGCLGCPTSMGTGHLQNITYSIIGYFTGEAVNHLKLFCDLAIICGLAFGALCGSVANSYLKGYMAHDFLLSAAMVPMIVLFSIDDWCSTPPPDLPKQASFKDRIFSHPSNDDLCDDTSKKSK